MRALAMYEGGRFELEDIPVPETPPGWGLIRTIASVAGLFQAQMAAGMLDTLGFPRILGHEIVGEVVEVSSDAAPQPGSVVVADAVVGCGVCEWCIRGDDMICPWMRHLGINIDGGFADYVAVPESHMFPIKAGTPVEEAVMLGSALPASVHAARRAGIRGGHRVVVTGVGSIGLTICQVARAMGATSVVAVDIADDRLDAAAPWTDGTVNVSGIEPKEAAAMVRDTLGPPAGADIVFEAAGHINSVDLLCADLVEEPDVEHLQWHLGELGAVRLWNGWPVESDGRKRQVKVAVIDSLVDTRHYDLDETVVLPAHASVSSLGNTPCENDHGTHVAGIIAAEAANDLGGSGVAPDATVLSFPTGSVRTATDHVNSLTHLINQAISAGAEVINLSLGVARLVTATSPSAGHPTQFLDSPPQSCHRSRGCEDPLETLIISATMGIGRADGVGVVFVAVAGNCGVGYMDPRCQYVEQLMFPAGYPAVISVAASTETGDHATFSSANDSVDITAPGDRILSTTVTEDTPGRQHLMTFGSGTSMAAPMISSIVAHLKARFPEATNCDITDALYKTAYFPPPVTTTAGTLSFTTQQLGRGHVRPQAAIEHLQTSGVGRACAPPPKDTTTPTIAKVYSAVEVGDNYSCGLRTDGIVVCWGLNDANQASPPADTKFTEISAGQRLTCGLREDGTIQCWGRGNLPPDGEFRALTVDDNHGCAIGIDGLAECWVIRNYGNTAKAKAPVDVRFVDIAASAIHSCGLTDEIPVLRSVECWGGDQATGWFTGGGQVSDRPRGTGFLEVAADSEYSCAIRTPSRKITCWGSDRLLFFGPTGRTIPTDGEFLDVAPGHQHACGIRLDGSITCWGRDTDRVLKDAPASGKYIDISSGDFHSCALRDNGTIECWGRNNDGQTDVP